MDRIVMGERLIKLRGNTPREKVCCDLEISFSALQSYESGNRVPKDDLKVKIANYYGTTVSYLFFNQNDT